jgi:hypothetical protein
MLTYFYSAQSQNSALMGDELDFIQSFNTLPSFRAAVALDGKIKSITVSKWDNNTI